MSKFNMDAHMHFDLYKDRIEVLNYIENHMSYTIAVTNLPDLYRKYLADDWNYKYVRLALGFHPELAYEFSNQIHLFSELVKTTRFIGEIGLDYSIKDEKNREVQRIIFTKIVSFCREDAKKILSVHSRNAESDCLNILDGFKGKVILHWYSGNIQNLKIALSRGYYFSINNQMISSQKGKKIICNIPINRIVIESDAPFTKSVKNSYNLSFYSDTLHYLAELYDVELEEIETRIKENFRDILI